MLPRPCLALTALVLASSSAAAAGDGKLSYSYIQASASKVDVDGFDDEADQYGLRAAFELPLNFYIVGDYSSSSLDLPGQDRETDFYAIGGGYHMPLGPVDVLGELQWVYNSADFPSGDEDESGVQGYLGARWMAFDLGARTGIELFGGVRGTEVDNQLTFDDSVFSTDLGARLHFLGFASAAATYSFIEDDDAITLDLRASF